MILARPRSYLTVILALISFAFVAVWATLPNQTFAEETSSPWSWVDSSPVAYSSTEVANIDAGLCPSFYETVEVAGYSGLKKECLTSGGMARVGYFPAGSVFRMAVGFKFGTKMYKFNGPCDRYDDCLYLPDTDTLVTKQHLVNGYVKSLVIYKNFSSRLIPVVTPGVITNLEYNFDISDPYIFESSDGYAWPVGGYGVSDNGKWLAVEIRQRGYGLLNIDTLEMKRFSNVALSYNVGLDPTSELAVSNDGRYVAIAGMNAGLSLYEISSDCGDIATDEVMSTLAPSDVLCRTASINYESFINSFHTALQPKFGNDGAELRFYAVSYSGAQRQVALRASGYTSQRLDYLALGDSYSSGEGELDNSFYLNGTNDIYENCHVSSRSYPFLLAQRFGIDLNYMKSVACSGAKTEDIIGSDTHYSGQLDRLGESGTNLGDVGLRLARNYALYYFVPGRIHQETFVDHYKPSVITIGVGGNDANLMGKLRTCVGIGTCEWARDAATRQQTAVEIQSKFNVLVDTYQKLIKDSPNSKIYAIGYPKIIYDEGACSSLDQLLDNTEKRFMNESISYLNMVVESAAKAAGIKYVDIENSYGSSVICGDGMPGAVNSIELGDIEELVNDFNYFQLIHSESFHPNSLGHQMVANYIADTVGDIMTYDYCKNGQTTCPNDSIAPPEMPDYWLYGDYPNDLPLQLSIDSISGASASDALGRNLIIGGGSLYPDSTVDIEIHSEPISLGQFVVAGDGSLSATLRLPENLDEGYHTIHLYGTSYSGRPVDLYQIILYKKIVNVVDEPVGTVVIDDEEVNTADPDGAIIVTGNSEVEPPSSVPVSSDIPRIVKPTSDTVQHEHLNQVPDTVQYEYLNQAPNKQEVKGASISKDVVTTMSNSEKVMIVDSDKTDNYSTYLIITSVGLLCVAMIWIFTRRLRDN